MIGSCIEFVDALDSHERAKRATEFYNKMVMRKKSGKKIPVPREARPELEPHLIQLKRYADEETIYYIAEHARQFDEAFQDETVREHQGACGAVCRLKR